MKIDWTQQSKLPTSQDRVINYESSVAAYLNLTLDLHWLEMCLILLQAANQVNAADVPGTGEVPSEVRKSSNNKANKKQAALSNTSTDVSIPNINNSCDRANQQL